MVAKLLEQAYKRAKKLPEHEQEAIAQIILKEVSEREKLQVKISPELRAMIDKARKNYREGRTEELDPDTL